MHVGVDSMSFFFYFLHLDPIFSFPALQNVANQFLEGKSD